MKQITSSHIHDQRVWSAETFGPGFRTGVFRHLEKELVETEKAPDDVSEWADIIILAIDGATRAGHDPEALIGAYHEKIAKNRTRVWPDWRGLPTDVAIEHDRSHDR